MVAARMTVALQRAFKSIRHPMSVCFSKHLPVSSRLTRCWRPGHGLCAAFCLLILSTDRRQVSRTVLHAYLLAACCAPAFSRPDLSGAPHYPVLARVDMKRMHPPLSLAREAQSGLRNPRRKISATTNTRLRDKVYLWLNKG